MFAAHAYYEKGTEGALDRRQNVSVPTTLTNNYLGASKSLVAKVWASSPAVSMMLSLPSAAERTSAYS